MRRQVLALGVLVALAVTANSYAQQPPVEYFHVRNSSGKRIWVHMRAVDEVRYQQPIQIDPGKAGTIRLRGFEPFDIVINQEGGGVYRAEDQFLCSVMRECARTGKQNWTMRFDVGQWIKGELRPRWFAAPGTPLRLLADEDETLLEFDVILVRPNRPIIKP